MENATQMTTMVYEDDEMVDSFSWHPYWQPKIEKKNIIFLDMDGVLCTPRACVAMGNEGSQSYLDPISCNLLKRLCDDFDCHFVVSSTWRSGYTDRHQFGSLLNAVCPNLGDFIFPHETAWRTPSLKHYPDPNNRRGEEIKTWLKENDLHTKMFIILDDDSDIEPFKDYFVKCHTYDGFTLEAYIKARALLGDK